MSIYENVAAGLVLAGRVARWEVEERVERSLRRAALWYEVKDKFANRLPPLTSRSPPAHHARVSCA
jgi:ABC-type phosphate transport system ATPase subunit